MKRQSLLSTLHFRLLISLSIAVLCGCSTKEEANDESAVTKSSIIKGESGYQLLLDGEPFFIQGAGLEFGSIPKLAAHGANSFRTWRTDNGQRSGKEVLDDAEKYGLKVTMGIDVGRERHGFDYDDEEAVKAQLERIRGEVMELKDHPALIIWGIGNELNHEAENPKVWDAVNEISKMIHEVDPNHLTTTSLAGMNKEYVHLIMERAPDLDILSVQMYAEVEILPRLLKESGWEGPLMVTEWGATGYWEVGSTEWGAPVENNSSVKADFYMSRYRNAIESQKAQVVGSYVFLWGQKQERTPTWFGMFMPDGKETESIDVMHNIWNGSWPENRSPRINAFSLEEKGPYDNIRLKTSTTYNAMVDVTDPDGDELSYRWEIMKESTTSATGGDAEEVPEVLIGIQGGTSNLKFTTPLEGGAYRLFIYVDDNMDHTAHANIPFFVGN